MQAAPITVRPQRTAATIARRRIRRIAQREQRVAVPNTPIPQAGTNPTTCPLCSTAIQRNQNTERCQNCLVWVHHACVEPLLEQFDWQCRGLCGHPNLQQTLQTCPVGCGQPFRLDNIAVMARWLSIFGTRMWARYAANVHAEYVLPMSMTNRGEKRWYPQRLRPQPNWWLCRDPNVTNRQDRKIFDPQTTAIHPRDWNRPNRPRRVIKEAFSLYRYWVDVNSPVPVQHNWRHQRFFILPTHDREEDDPLQGWTFSPLNVVMHDAKRRGWERFRRLYDDHGVTVAQMEDM